MSYANDITYKVEGAAKAYLVSAALTTVDSADIHSGVSNDDLDLPHVVCSCREATVEDVFDGNWSAELVVRVVSSAADTTAAAHHDRAGEVFSNFFLASDTVATNLCSADLEFTAQAVYPRRQTRDLVTADGAAHWVSELLLTVKCCGSVVA